MPGTADREARVWGCAMNQARARRSRVRFPVAVVLVATLCAAGPRPARAGDPTDVARVGAWLAANVPELMREAKLPGFSIAVVRRGETVYAEGFGARDPKQNLPATPDTLYGIGSVTKSFVAIAILQLAEQGKLNLSDPVSRHVPLELGLPGKPITIRHLLTHSPGFPNLGTSTVLISRGLGADTGIPMSSAADFYRFVNGAQAEIVFEPGEHFFYNNAAWRMLGHIVQEKSGQPFHRYIKEKLLDPLGMKRSTLDTGVVFADADHLVPHRRGKDGPEAAPFPYPNPEANPGFSFLSAAGGIVSSVNEMTRYLNAQIGQGRHPGGQLASPEAFAQMQALQIETEPGYYGKAGYGYGLSVTPDFLGHRLVSHGGSISVSTAHIAFIPDLELGIVMMGNGPGMSYGTIAETVFALMLGRDPDEALPANGIRTRMDRLLGSYATYRGLETLKVYKRGGLLYIGADEDASGTPLIPEDPSYRRWRFHTLRDGLQSPVEFRLGEHGLTLLVGRYAYHKQD
jgi:CubicO group peptidase (beta-lactamase class C family)